VYSYVVEGKDCSCNEASNLGRALGTHCGATNEVCDWMFAVRTGVQRLAGAKRATVARRFARAMVAVGAGTALAAAVSCHTTLKPVQPVRQGETAVFTLPRVRADAFACNAEASLTAAFQVGRAALSATRCRALVKQPPAGAVQHWVLGTILERRGVLRASVQDCLGVAVGASEIVGLADAPSILT